MFVLFWEHYCANKNGLDSAPVFDYIRIGAVDTHTHTRTHPEHDKLESVE